MYDELLGPTIPSPEQTVWPIQKFATRHQDNLDMLMREVPDSMKWILAQQIFEARMAMINKLLEEDYVAVEDPRLTIVVQLDQRAIPAESGVGEEFRLHDDRQAYVTTLRYDWSRP